MVKDVKKEPRFLDLYDKVMEKEKLKEQYYSMNDDEKLLQEAINKLKTSGWTNTLSNEEECEMEHGGLIHGPFEGVDINVVANGFIVTPHEGGTRDVYVLPNVKALQAWLKENLSKTHVQNEFVEDL